MHGAYAVPRPQIAELGDLAIGRGPEVDAGAEADGEHVLRGPVDEVEIEVVLQGGRVQDLMRRFGDLPGWLLRRRRVSGSRGAVMVRGGSFSEG